MLAFTKTTMTKSELVKELKIHQKADNFIQGTYSKSDMNGNFKGCAIGCSLESLGRKKGIEVKESDHWAFVPHFGIPVWLAKLEDRIFERLPSEEAKKWPVKFTSAINPGSDLNEILRPYLIFICESVVPFVDAKKHAAVLVGIKLVIKLLKDKKTTGQQFFDARLKCRSAAAAAAADAYAAAAAAAAADAYAADAADAAAAAADAAAAYAADAYAADAYAAAAADAAADAYAAAAADAYAADAADAAAAAAAAADAYAAKTKMIRTISEKVIELIKNCKPKKLKK